MKILKALCIVLMASSPALAATSNPLHLSGQQHWLTVASTKDLNAAIGIARQFDDEGLAPRVVSSRSGWFAVVLGPYRAKSISQLRNTDTRLPELPGDALLSRGDRYQDTVWQPAATSRNWTEYGVDRPARLSSGDLEIEVGMNRHGADAIVTTIRGTQKGATAFLFKPENSAEFTEQGATATLAKLDPKTLSPQVLATRYTGGAHCCTTTWIATKPDGAAGWSLVDGANLDGGGYGLEDVDADGGQELISVDNAFLYAFDSYAGSFAPMHILKLVGRRIEDVSREDAMRARLIQELAGMEFQAKVRPEIWKTNGFLAGWVAAKMRLGEGDAAWRKMLSNYEKNSDFGPQTCTSGQKTEDCPSENLRTIPFPKALADFLSEQDYGDLPNAARLAQ
jgi:serine protease Do